MITTILQTLLGIFIGSIFFCLVMIAVFFFKTRTFRKKCDEYWCVKVYDNEQACYGTILRRLDDRVYIEFVDAESRLQKSYFNIKDIFPAW
jgi:hypothetical protein